MSWANDKVTFLLWICGGLIGFLFISAGQLWSDVQSLKEYRAASGAASEEVNRRLERIELKIDHIIEGMGK